jgi:hypothetical protein
MPRYSRHSEILVALSLFDYLTAAQITRLLYAPSSHAHVRKLLNTLVASGFVLPLTDRTMTMPRVYTLTETGCAYISALGMPERKRVRLTEERDKARNLFFLEHTIAVSDVLIAAKLLSHTVPGIQLTRIITERSLKRKIYVELPEPRQTQPEETGEGTGQQRTICIEPDASCDFTVTETWHEAPQTWQDFVHIEVYRSLPPAEWRFKQKIKAYVAYATSGQHEALFATPALAIAIFAQTPEMAQTLKRWTEQALQEGKQPGHGGLFFFGSIAVATATPAEIFLAPHWEQAFGKAKTPLLVLEEAEWE